jgi:hypothetical protein
MKQKAIEENNAGSILVGTRGPENLRKRSMVIDYALVHRTSKQVEVVSLKI